MNSAFNSSSGDDRPLFVILQRLSPIGGIETLVLRLIPYLLRVGNVAVFGTRKDDAVTLPDDVPFIQVDSDAGLIRATMRYIAHVDRSREIVLLSLHPWSLVLVYVMRYLNALNRRRPLRSFHLVTHSRAMFFSGGRIAQSLIRRIFLSAPAASSYFMNDAARDAHATRWRADLSRFPILRLPVADPLPMRHSIPGWELNIISVGRLVEFKGYNRGAPHIMRDLLEQGVVANWEIWGDGEDRAAIEQEIEQLGVGHKLRLMGELPYANFDNIVANADIFVGVGTALLEAARIGVPSICAVEMSQNESYGFFSQTPSDSVGDIVAGAKRNLIANDLMDFAAMDVGARRQVAEACQQEVVKRSANLSDFADAVRTAEAWPASLGVRAMSLASLGWAAARLRDRTIRRLGT